MPPKFRPAQKTRAASRTRRSNSVAFARGEAILAYNYSRLKVLIVDDSKLMRELIRSLLELVGVQRMRSTEDAEKAWGAMYEFEPDLVITDWNMPPTSGLDFVKRIRSDPRSPNPFVPVIMVTGYAEEDRVELARDIGTTDFLAKPVMAQTLFDRLKSIVDDDRDFVRSQDFFGPDRRRRRDEYDGSERRDAVMGRA